MENYKIIENFVRYIVNSKDIGRLKKIRNKVSRFVMDRDEDVEIEKQNKKFLIKNFLFTLCSNKILELEQKSTYKYRLSNYLKRNLITGKQLQKYENKLGTINRRVGCIPNIFFLNVSDKKNTAIGLYKIFEKYSTKLNYIYTSELSLFNKYSRILSLDKTLTNLSIELSNLLNQPIKVEFYGQGCNGNAFKLFIKDKIFIYKTFYPYHDSTEIYHGAGFEIQAALFANHNSRKSRFVKFYFGQMGTFDYFDAFMICDFVEDNKNSDCNLHIDYLTVIDFRIRNLINHKIIDFGGLIENNKPLKNKNLRKLVRIICNNISYNYNEKNLKISFKISPKGILTIKSQVSKYKKDLYYQAIKIISKELKLSQNVIKMLKNIDNVPEINIKKQLSLKNLIVTKIKKVKNIVEEYKLVIEMDSEPQPQIGINDGTMIIKLPNDFILVYLYDINNTISRIKLEKKSNNVFVNIFDLNSDDIENFIKSNNNLFVSDLINNNAVVK